MTEEQKEKCLEYASDVKGEFHTCNGGEHCVKCDNELEAKAKATDACADCSQVLDLEDRIESLLQHEMIICPACIADRRQEDKADLALKDL